MSSKRRLRWKQCENKVRHKTFEHAVIAKKASIIKCGPGFQDVVPYQCPWCAGWHLGHRPRQVERAIEASRLARGPGRFKLG